MKINKKGIFFTFISILVASVLAMTYSTYQITPLDYKVELEKMKVLSTNNYLINLMSYTENTMRTASYASMREMIDYISENTFYANEEEINNTFKEVISNGTINSVFRPRMENYTIKSFMDKIKNISGEKLEMDIDYTINDIWIEQNNAFNLNAYLNISLVVRSNNMIWNITEIKSSEVPIQGLKDPIYFNIGYNNTFKQTNKIIRNFNLTTYEDFINKSEYIVTPHSIINITSVAEFRPLSFYGRLTNRYDIKNDMELTLLSLVDPNKLNATGTSYINQSGNVSYIDYMYSTEFNDYNCQAILKKVVGASVNQPIVDKQNLLLIFNFTGSQVIPTDTC